ncbi:MAG: methyltransferase domain-containing protein [Coriobacteriaceae bacterium]|nr:methyltransferase domain-containing protein [Coriobacteriaceae bacterium]
MRDKYQNQYATDNIYGSVVEILKDLSVSEGVHLDLGCGFGAIAYGIKENNLHVEYLGIDSNVDSVDYLLSHGCEAYVHEFTDIEATLAFIQTLLKGRSIASISILDVLEHLPNPKLLLEIAHTLSLKYHAPLVISVPNIAHRDITFKLLEGRFDYTETGLLDASHISFFTHQSLEQMMRLCGFEMIRSRDFEIEVSDQHFPADSPLLSADTTVYKYLDWLKGTFDPHATVNQFIRAYLAMPRRSVSAPEDQAPFLSVIIRTQGKRPEALSETLLCLTAQTMTDFEVLVLGHKVDVEHQLIVEKAIGDTPEWLRNQIRFIKVDRGGRATPLHIGFAQAKGDYIAILDDDDLLFDNWIEVFHDLAASAPGTILHSFAVTQEWETTSIDNRHQDLCSIGPISDIYCKEFDVIDQLKTNYCPASSYAIPRYIYQHLNINFNLELDTTEDWDLLMRSALLCGVSESRKVTFLYRLWKNGDNSRVLHDSVEWQENYDLIRIQLNRTPFIMPPGYIYRLGDLLEGKTQIRFSEEEQVYSKVIGKKREPVLYLDLGEGFSEKSRYGATQTSPNTWQFSSIPPAHQRALRLDPGDFGSMTISELLIDVLSESGETKRFSARDVDTNGYVVGNRILFLQDDPQITLILDIPAIIKTVTVSYQRTESVDLELILASLHFARPFSVLYRSLRKLKRRLKR